MRTVRKFKLEEKDSHRNLALLHLCNYSHHRYETALYASFIPGKRIVARV